MFSGDVFFSSQRRSQHKSRKNHKDEMWKNHHHNIWRSNVLVFTRFQSTRHRWRIAFALDTGGVPDNGGQEGINGNNSNLNATRLGRIVTAGGRQLLEKLNLARKDVPMKVFLLLLGFYTANALATILGQTGDWDVLVAGIVVAAIEGHSQSSGRLKSFVMNHDGRLLESRCVLRPLCGCF